MEHIITLLMMVWMNELARTQRVVPSYFNARKKKRHALEG